MASVRFCEVCKTQIDTDRAAALPATRLCEAHGREIEAFGGEFTVSAQQERTSKSGSLKINYGGIATHQERNEDAVQRLKDHYEAEQAD